MHVLIVGGAPADRRGAVHAHLPSTHTLFTLDAATLPFVRLEDVALPPAPRVLVVDGIERACPDAQSGGTRLVLTQSTYLLQKWIDRLDERDLIIATADRAELTRVAPEFLEARGCWSAFEIVDLEDTEKTEDTEDGTSSVSFVASVSLSGERLASAFTVSDPIERLRLCQDATQGEPSSPVAWLACASACRETRDGVGAREALDRAAELAPEWEAVAFEGGKLFLAYDDLPRARDAFQRAADLMPTFSAAFSNLGAALGELGEPAAALQAFRDALAHDPRSVTLLNNIGVVYRELGRLDESETAFRDAIGITPAFVFAHYNLGHTLFLVGRYADALAAYEEGQRRDPQQNRRQGCRMAVVRFATGDAAGAERDLWRSVSDASPDEREDLLLEAYEIGHAVLTRHPELAPHRWFLDRLGAEIAKSE